MSLFLGIDTSNYTTSVALYDNSTGEMRQQKKLLPVKPGELGLRQSDAVFHHVQQLPELLEQILSENNEPIAAVGVSDKPRNQEGSYMPCFTVGHGTARAMATALNIPLLTFSHQQGHIAAALYSADKLYLLHNTFLAFHVSGGTTEAVLVQPDNTCILRAEIVAKSLDLHAGQAVDRVGGMLNLPFPSGPELEKLALEYNGEIRVKPTLKEADCCLSGIENQCKRLLEEGRSPQEVARTCLEYIGAALDAMCGKLLEAYGSLPVVFAGGVMSNSILRERLEKKYGAAFAQPAFSSDNAAGIAVLTALSYRRG